MRYQVVSWSNTARHLPYFYKGKGQQVVHRPEEIKKQVNEVWVFQEMLNRSQGMSEITYAERFEDAIDKAAGETHSLSLSISIPTLEVERKKRTFGNLIFFNLSNKRYPLLLWEIT